ncbi:unnamed protein product [Mycena citricolor]|uniref:Uncharacterized protein n=1 Tax=Mycena citricolor TaxID=2018698 RepID=A0AAD2H384_9AGAR|nr:unnamed protein product [Mycena citricolor]
MVGSPTSIESHKASVERMQNSSRTKMMVIYLIQYAGATRKRVFMEERSVSRKSPTGPSPHFRRFGAQVRGLEAMRAGRRSCHSSAGATRGESCWHPLGYSPSRRSASPRAAPSDEQWRRVRFIFRTHHIVRQPGPAPASFAAADVNHKCIVRRPHALQCERRIRLVRGCRVSQIVIHLRERGGRHTEEIDSDFWRPVSSRGGILVSGWRQSGEYQEESERNPRQRNIPCVGEPRFDLEGDFEESRPSTAYFDHPQPWHVITWILRSGWNCRWENCVSSSARGSYCGTSGEHVARD